MRRFVDLLLPVLTVGLMVTGMNDLAAQQLDHDHEPLIDAAGRAYTCGTHYMSEYDYEAALERTRINNPQMYAQLVAQAEGKWIRPNLRPANFHTLFAEQWKKMIPVWSLSTA